MNSLKEHSFNFESFIGGWYIPYEMCDKAIDYFKNNRSNWVEGGVGVESKLDYSKKKSTEIIFPPINFFNIFPEYNLYLQIALNEYLKKYIHADEVAKFSVNTNVKIQYYNLNEGFKNFHSENTGDGYTLKRHLVFMTYLNDVEDGGTEFKYQKIISPAIKGLTLIWPAQWTHTHRGQISSTKEKYIITGWFSFNEE